MPSCRQLMELLKLIKIATILLDSVGIASLSQNTQLSNLYRIHCRCTVVDYVNCGACPWASASQRQAASFISYETRDVAAKHRAVISSECALGRRPDEPQRTEHAPRPMPTTPGFAINDRRAREPPPRAALLIKYQLIIYTVRK